MKITRQTCNRIQIIWTRIIFAQGENRIFPSPRKIIKKNFNNKPKQEKLSNTKPFRNARRSLYISSSISISLLSSITETFHFLFSFFSILEPRISNRGKIFRSFFSFNKKKKKKANIRQRDVLFFPFFLKKTHGYTRDSTNARVGTRLCILTVGRLYVYILETHSHSTSTVILLLTVGGTPLVAMQRYAPISLRVILVKFNCSPSYRATETKSRNWFSPVGRANIVYRPEQTVAFDINVQTGSLRREEPGTGFIGETFSVKWNPFFRREGEGEGERKGQRAAREGKRKKGERKKRNPLKHASIYEANFPVLFFYYSCRHLFVPPFINFDEITRSTSWNFPVTCSTCV